MSAKDDEGEKKQMLDVEMKPQPSSTTNGKKEPEPEPKPSKKERYRAKLKRIAMGCTVKGLSRSFASKRYKFKLLWGILFIVGVVMFCINIHKVAVRYHEEPILTQFDRRQIPFKWPHITLCNPSNPIAFWAKPELKANWEALSKTFKEKYEKNLPRYNGIPLWDQYVMMSSIDPSVYFQSSLNATIQSIKVNFQQTSMASSSGDFDQYKTVSNIEKASMTILDSIRFPMACYHIAPDKLAKLTDSTSGLVSLKLYVIMDFATYKYFNIGYESRKLYMYIHNANSTVDKTSPFYIIAGTDSGIKLKQRSRKRVKDCTDKQYSVELYDAKLDKTLRFNGNFEDCRLHHSQSMFFKKCACYNPFLPLYKFDDRFPKVCTNMSLFDSTALNRNVECMNKVLESTKRDSSYQKQLNKTCGEYRRKPCQENSYYTSRDTNQWQGDMSPAREKAMAKNLRFLLPNAPKNATPDFAYRNLAIIKIMWNKEPPESTFESYEYSSAQLTSDIGGIAGLWLGLSLISVFELVEVLYFVFKYTMAK